MYRSTVVASPSILSRLVLAGLLGTTCLTAAAMAQAAPQQQATPAVEKIKLVPEAKVAAERGAEALAAKKYKEAIGLFKGAIRLNPEQAELRYLLAAAYAESKQLGLAWLQVRQAVRLNPKHAPSVRAFLDLWQPFDNRGVFDCGRGSQEIAKVIGKPDDRRADGTKEVWQYGFKQIHFENGRLSAVIDPRGITPEMLRSNDKLNIEFVEKERWRVGYRTIDRIQSLTHYVPAGQAVKKWDELYSVQRLYNLAKVQTPEKMMKAIEENLRSQNPKVEFVVLAERPGDVLFHWRDVGSVIKKRKPQHEIVRLIAGPRDIHRIAYAQRVAEIPLDIAKRWMAVLENASLVENTPTAAVGP